MNMLLDGILLIGIISLVAYIAINSFRDRLQDNPNLPRWQGILAIISAIGFCFTFGGVNLWEWVQGEEGALGLIPSLLMIVLGVLLLLVGLNHLFQFLNKKLIAVGSALFLIVFSGWLLFDEWQSYQNQEDISWLMILFVILMCGAAIFRLRLSLESE